MCQLEGSDHGGRDSAAELALAGGIDVNVGRLLQPADFGVSPTRRGNYTPPKLSVNGFVRSAVIHLTPPRGDRIYDRKARLYWHLTRFRAVPILQTPQTQWPGSSVGRARP